MPVPWFVAVSRDHRHRFSKVPVEFITLVAGVGVDGDAHAGPLVNHWSRVRRDPNQVHRRQLGRGPHVAGDPQGGSHGRPRAWRGGCCRA